MNTSDGNNHKPVRNRVMTVKEGKAYTGVSGQLTVHIDYCGDEGGSFIGAHNGKTCGPIGKSPLFNPDTDLSCLYRFVDSGCPTDGETKNICDLKVVPKGTSPEDVSFVVCLKGDPYLLYGKELTDDRVSSLVTTVADLQSQIDELQKLIGSVK